MSKLIKTATVNTHASNIHVLPFLCEIVVHSFYNKKSYTHCNVSSSHGWFVAVLCHPSNTM